MASEKENELVHLKNKVLNLLSNCNDTTIDSFERWISSKKYVEDLNALSRVRKADDKLKSVAEDIRSLVPLKAVMESEKIIRPEVGSNADCVDGDTLHVDEFLYEDDVLDTFFSGQQRFCGKCLSREIKEAQLISHSLSRWKLKHIFNVMLPSDCGDKKILDVGSRLGAVLYGAFFYTDCKNIFGIEMNKELCDVQRKIIESHRMQDRVNVIENDIVQVQDMLSTFDVVIMNNVFEFFEDFDKQIKIWRMLKRRLKRDCLLVTIPSIEETLENLRLYGEFADWLRRADHHQRQNSIYDDEDESEYHDIYLYRVK